jgi:hypothetical protein
VAVEPFLQQAIPDSIGEFLRQPWQTVLLKIWLSKGEADEEWKTHLKVIDDLIWSIQPKLDSEERKKMSRVLPEMLKLLDNGLKTIDQDEEDRSRWLDIFFQLQTMALQGKSTLSAKHHQADNKTSASPAIWSEIRVDSLSLKTARQHQSRSTGAYARIGDWLEFDAASLGRLCGRVCRINPDTETHLLINPDWQFAIALQVDVVAAQLHDKLAAIVSTASLFDSAAEKALRNAPKRDVLT